MMIGRVIVLSAFRAIRTDMSKRGQKTRQSPRFLTSLAHVGSYGAEESDLLVQGLAGFFATMDVELTVDALDLRFHRIGRYYQRFRDFIV